MEFTEEEKKDIEFLRSRYPNARSLVLPLLWMIQQRIGWVPEESVNLIAGELNIPPIWVEEARTWYSMFEKQKKGKYIREVCHNSTCAIHGTDEILEQICHKLKIKVGETTVDGLFTLQHSECLGSCGTGPAMRVGDVCYDKLTPERIDEILTDLRTGKLVEPQPQEFPEYR